jgi:hypothetical protein
VWLRPELLTAVLLEWCLLLWLTAWPGLQVCKLLLLLLLLLMMMMMVMRVTGPSSCEGTGEVS